MAADCSIEFFHVILSRYQGVNMQPVPNPSTNHSINEQLEIICQSRFTGQLEIRSHSERWTLYFCLSRLIWADGGTHPKRRWKRLFTRSCPDLDLALITIRDSDAFECQNYHVLNVLLKRRLVTQAQLNTLIHNTISEVLFDILQRETLTPLEYRQQAASANFLWESGIKLPITRISVDRALQDTRQAWKAWCDRGWGNISPNLVPVCPPHIDPSNPNYKTLLALTNTKQTLRDIAAKSKKDESEVVQLLFPFQCQGTLEFVKVADLPSERVAHRSTKPSTECKRERRKKTHSEQGVAGVEATLKKLKRDRATGVLQVSHRRETWQFYVWEGQLLCVAGGSDRARRWYRALKQHAPDFYEAKLPQSLAREPWEYRLLARGLSEGQLARVQAQKIIGFCVREVLFALQCCQDVSHQWRDLTAPEPISGLMLDVEKVIARVKSLLAQKQSLQLPPFCPNWSPLLRQPIGGNTNLAMSQFLSGHHSLWDIALELKRPVTAIASSVFRAIERGAIELKPIPDLVAPIIPDCVASHSPSDRASGAVPPLIACIDDSPTTCDDIGAIVTDAGYRFIAIQDSVQAIPMLLDRKPDLILLDLVMPIASGYEVCAQIRRISQFKDIPAIVVTGNDGVVDRFRAKITGASGFASKPLDRKTLLRIIEKYVTPMLQKQKS